ncbi:MAG: TolC family protein, partial [Deltaproteobacteria bacterium]|nr:TolC family protein [Deltaproteobacteria bacterium]
MKIRIRGLSISSLWLLLYVAVASIGTFGCATMNQPPEFNPERWAPSTTDAEWSARNLARNELKLEPPFVPLTRPASGHDYDLASLIDLALLQNPETREAWQAARAAAAGWAIKRAPFYPLLSVSSESGYDRKIDLVPKHWSTLKNWQSANLLTLNYLLIDFGRTHATAEAAHEQLLAANFEFNREIQTIVFQVERNYYLLDAERAGLDAAQAIVRLAKTDLRAVNKRHAGGLATKPDVLLAEQREAKSAYELQNAELGVRDAEADLATAVGLQVNSMPHIQTSNTVSIPTSVKDSVDDLINAAMRQRPDLAAAMTNLSAKNAQVAFARDSMYPTLNFSSYYGTNAFNYRLSNPPTPQYTAMGPEYGAMLTLKWDVFAGMEHVNSINQAEHDRDRERARLRATEIDVAAEVWRAYYAFETSL